MSYGNANTAQSLNAETERDTFFGILTHDDRDSLYFVAEERCGLWSERAVTRSELFSIPLDDSSSYYVTHNGFTGSRRLLGNTRQLNALFFDIDCHGSQKAETFVAVACALKKIDHAVRGGFLPSPSIVVDSGRGIHLYYALERSVPCRSCSRSSLDLFADVQERLARLLNSILSDVEGMDVDRAVFDHTRVSRIPGTYNPKAGRRARLVAADGGLYSLGGLAKTLPPLPRKTNPAKKGSMVRFNPLMISRMRKIEELQSYRSYDCKGSRELMCFAFYNTLVQVYDKLQAADRLQTFNARFSEPLRASELEGIVRSVDSVVNVKGQKGFYVLSAKKLSQLLSLSQSEIDDLCFFGTKRTLERLAAKRETAVRRQRRNERIVALYETGDFTQSEVAAEVGCSLRTVCSVLSSAGIRKRRPKDNKPARPRSLCDAATASNLPRTGPSLPFRLLTEGPSRAYLECAKKCLPCLGGVEKGALGYGKVNVRGVFRNDKGHQKRAKAVAGYKKFGKDGVRPAGMREKRCFSRTPSARAP